MNRMMGHDGWSGEGLHRALRWGRIGMMREDLDVVGEAGFHVAADGCCVDC